MAERTELSRGAAGDVIVALAANAVALAGVFHAGSGFRNGDAAVYAAQAWAGDLGERPVHVGYIAVASLLAYLGEARLPYLLDLLTALSAGVAVAAITSRVEGAGKPVVALLIGIALLPECAFAEVDVPWFALVALSVAVSGTLPAAVLACAAVLVSPTALAAMPWVAVERLRRDPPEKVALLAVAVACTVSALLGATQSDWWAGDRGVGTFTPDPLATWHAWGRHLDVLGPAALLGVLALIPEASRRRWSAVLATGPLLLAPTDVPAWLVPAAALAIAAGEGIRAFPRPKDVSLALAALLSVWALLAGGAGLQRNVRRVEEEKRITASVAAEMQPGDGLVAPWSWGVRVSVQATGDPYAVRWRVPGEPVRNQEWAFCDGLAGRVAVLPPFASLPGADDVEPDERGVRWYEAAVARAIYCDG